MELTLIFGLVALAPLIICTLLYVWFRKKGWSRTAWLFPVLLLAYSYLWYDAFYPSNTFYEKEFIEITRIPWPISARIVNKASTYPDIHGDYSSCASLTVSRSDFNSLLDKVKKDSSFSLMDDKSLFIGSNTFHSVTKSFVASDYLYKFHGAKSPYMEKSGAYILMAFLTDYKTIIIYRTSS